MLLQAEQDNIAFYESAIRNMQREIDALKYSSVSAAVAVRSSKNGTIFFGSTTAELLADAKTLLQKGSPNRCLRGVDTLLIEFCASADSELTKNVSYGFASLRITDKEDFTRARTLDAILQIICIARKNDVKVKVWVATPCTSGCPWSHVNIAKGFTTGDKALCNK